MIDNESLVTELEIHAAVAAVDDPEYPGISIVDLGLLEAIEFVGESTAGAHVRVDLIPTFSGCPALDLIADDVRRSIEAIPHVAEAEIRWRTSPVWSLDRVSADARTALAKEFTVGIELGRRASGVSTCPRCGAKTAEQSLFGPSRCRSVHECSGCGETVEVLRA